MANYLPKFNQSILNLPRAWKCPDKAIDYYNDHCFDKHMQWKFGVTLQPKQFVLECPFAVICPVRCKFTYSESKQAYIRDSIFPLFHDHCI